LSADDRFEEIKRLLDSTLDEFQTLFQTAGDFEETRVGNGWSPEKLLPDIYCLKPKPVDELARIARSRKRSLFRNHMISFLKPHEDEVKEDEEPRLAFVPFWKIKGFHECFYFRGNSYKIDLPEDVVAVEVEGKIRDLVGQESTDAQRLTNLTRRLLGRRDWSNPKSFLLGNATELAYMYKEGSIFLNADGHEDLEAEAFFEGKVPLQKTSNDELATRFKGVEVTASSVTKEDMIRRLHTIIVKPPAAFSKILSNRFQITELAQYLMPVYYFMFEWKGDRKELAVHGYSGAFFP
jgi:hypothetical protein